METKNHRLPGESAFMRGHCCTRGRRNTVRSIPVILIGVISRLHSKCPGQGEQTAQTCAMAPLKRALTHCKQGCRRASFHASL
jgi:hypothetical protein